MIGSVTFPSRRSPPTGLPSAGLVAGEIQQVVDQLERHAQADAVLLQRALLLGRGVAEDPADARAAAEEIRRLAPNDVEVLVFGDARRRPSSRADRARLRSSAA